MKKFLIGALIGMSFPVVAQAQSTPLNAFLQLQPQGQQIAISALEHYRIRFVRSDRTIVSSQYDREYSRLVRDTTACDMSVVDGIRDGSISTPYDAAITKAKCLKARTDAEGLGLDVQLWGPTH
jgi:hypothetical protein